MPNAHGLWNNVFDSIFFLINNEKFNEPMLFWERTRQISPALGNTWTITASPYEGAKYWFSFKKKKAIYNRKFCLQFSLLFEKLSLLGHFIPLYQSERKFYQAIFTNVIRLSPVRDRLFYTAVFKFINLRSLDKLIISFWGW